MTRKTYKAIILISSVMILTILTVVSVFAADIPVAEGPDPIVYYAYSLSVMDSFGVNPYDQDVSGSVDAPAGFTWIEGDGMSSATIATDIPFEPFIPFSGDSCLLCTAKVNDANNVIDGGENNVGDNRISATVTGTREKYKRVSDSECMGFVINIPRGGEYGRNAEYKVSAILRSKTGDFSSSAVSVKGGVWTAVFIDTSSWGGKRNITGIDFTVTCDNYDGTAPLSFAIDEIAYFGSVSDSQAMQCLVPSDRWYGNSSSRLASRMRFSPNSEQFSIETYENAMPEKITSLADSVSMLLDNECGAKSVTMQYNTSVKMSFTDNPSYTCELSSGRQTITFPIPKDGCLQLRFTFDGCSPGSGSFVDIISVYPTKNTAPERIVSYGTINSCVVDESENIIVTGILTDSAAQLSGGSINLYQLNEFQNSDAAYLKTITPAASVRATQEFTINVKGNVGYTGDRYVAAVSYGDQLYIIGSSYITNTEDRCDNPGTFREISALKGISSDSPEQTVKDSKYLFFGGASSIIIPLRIEKLYSYKTTSEGYNFNGTSFYFDSSYVKQIDEQLKACRDSGASVWMRLTVSMTDDNQLNSMLCAPESLKTSEYSAFNTGTRDGLIRYQAIFSYISKKWSSGTDSPVSGYIIGSSVNESRENWYRGNVSPDSFAESYAGTVRQAYLHLKAAGGAVRVAISVSGAFENSYPSDIPFSFFGEQFISAFDRYTSKSGDFGWLIELTLDEYNISLLSDDINREAVKAGAGAEVIKAGAEVTKDITIDNYELFDAFLGRDKLLYRQSKRSVIVNAGSAIGDFEYAYTFYKLSSSSSCASAKLLVISGKNADEFENMFSCIDTADSVSSVTESTGYSDWAALIPGFSASKVESRRYSITHFSSKLPDGLSGSFIVNSFDSREDINSLRPGIGCDPLDWFSGFTDRKGLARASFSLNDAASSGGLYYKFDYPLDLSKAPILVMDCTVVTLPVGTNQAQLTVMLVSGRSALSVTGQISDNGWQQAICDLTNYQDIITSVDGIRIWLSSYDGKPLGTPSLFTDSIILRSVELDDEELKNYFINQNSPAENPPIPIEQIMIWTLFGIAVLCASALIVRYCIGRGDRKSASGGVSSDVWKYD